MRMALQGLYALAAVCFVVAVVVVIINRPEVSVNTADGRSADDALAGSTAGDTNNDGADQSADESLVADVAAATATVEPTPVPTPTATPVPVSFVDAIQAHPVADELIAPIPDCPAFVPPSSSRRDAYRLVCADGRLEVSAVAAADGRVVHVVTEAPVPINGLPAELPSRWSWQDQSQLGTHIVVDHGPIGATSNVQTVYSGLNGIEPGVVLGSTVQAGQPIGVSRGTLAGVDFSIWTDGVRHDGVATLEPLAPDAATQLEIAVALGAATTSPTDDRCPLVLFDGQLPGAPRNYRNGTHRGIDFGCGAGGRNATAIADGTVVYVVDDYRDATPADRQALLDLAAAAQITPHWTLVMLYGNVVVIDHGVIDGAGRVVTIAAHLESVDPNVSLGARVSSGDVLGEIGNRGTAAASQGVFGADDPSLHLHWEIYIDGWFLGQGLGAAEVRAVIDAALCGTGQTAGC